MTITVFGATGMVGKEIVRLGLLENYTVKAFARNVFGTNFREVDNLQLIKGALFDEQAVRNALVGSDAVLSALGGSMDGTDQTRSLGIKNIIQQMKEVGVRRIVAIGGMGILDDSDGKLIMDDKDFPPNFLNVSKEHLKAYEYLKDSGLDWTLVCPPMMKNEQETGQFVTKANMVPNNNSSEVAAGDVAMLMLRELKAGKYINTRVGIANSE